MKKRSESRSPCHDPASPFSLSDATNARTSLAGSSPRRINTARVYRLDLPAQLSHSNAPATRHGAVRHQRDDGQSEARFHHAHDDFRGGRFHRHQRRNALSVKRVHHVLPAGRATLEHDQRRLRDVRELEPRLARTAGDVAARSDSSPARTNGRSRVPRRIHMARRRPDRSRDRAAVLLRLPLQTESRGGLVPQGSPRESVARQRSARRGSGIPSRPRGLHEGRTCRTIRPSGGRDPGSGGACGKNASPCWVNGDAGVGRDSCDTARPPGASPGRSSDCAVPAPSRATRLMLHASFLAVPIRRTPKLVPWKPPVDHSRLGSRNNRVTPQTTFALIAFTLNNFLTHSQRV